MKWYFIPENNPYLEGNIIFQTFLFGFHLEFLDFQKWFLGLSLLQAIDNEISLSIERCRSYPICGNLPCLYSFLYIYIHCKYRFIYTYIYWYFCFYILILFIMLYNVHFWFKVCSDLFLFKVKRLIFSRFPAKRWYVSTLPDTSSESPLERKGWRIRCDGAPRDPKQDSGFRRLKHPEKWRLFFWSRIWRQRGGCGLVFGKNGIMSHEEQNPKKRSIYIYIWLVSMEENSFSKSHA